MKLTALTNGLYKVRARATDNLGNMSDWTSFYYFKVDSNFPEITINSPAQGGWFNNDVEVNATASIGSGSSISKIMYKINANGNWNDYSIPSGLTTLTFAKTIKQVDYPNGGELKMFIRAYKDATNFSESSVMFNMDSKKPTLTLSSPANGAANLNQKIVFQGTSSDLIGSGATLGIIKDIKISIGSVVTNEDVIGISSFA